MKTYAQVRRGGTVLKVLMLSAAAGLAACSQGPVDVAVEQLNGGCYALQAQQAGLYLASRDLPLQERYAFHEADPQKAGHFRFTMTQAGVFQLTDRDGALLGSHVPFLEIALKEPSDKALWEVEKKTGGYELRNRATHALLRHTFREGEELREKTVIYESGFSLIPQDDCTE